MRRLQIGWSLVVPVVAIVLGAAFFVAPPMPLQALRNAFYDQYQRWDAKPYRESSVRIVDIDEASIAKLGQWPWPRTLLAELIEKLRESGASAVALDILLAEPDRTSPEAMAKTWHAGGALRRAISSLPDHDAQLAATISVGQVILGHAPTAKGLPSGAISEPFSITQRGPSPVPFLHDSAGTVAPLPSLQSVAAGIGALSFVADGDGVVRRVPLVIGVGERPMPTLAAEALRVSQGAKRYIVTTSSESNAGVESVHVGAFKIPTTAAGEVWVRYSTGNEARGIPAWRFLQGRLAPDSVKDCIVIVGSSAEGLRDLRFTPLGHSINGAQIHAQLLDQILEGDHLQRPNWTRGAELLVLVIGSLIVGVVALIAGALSSVLVLILLVGAVAWGGWIAYSQYRLILDPVMPSLAMGISFLASSLYHHMQAERRQRWIRQAFSRYVSPNLVSHLIEHPEALQLGGSRRVCSFVFTDLAGFTSLMEKLPPEEAVALLNEYLDNMIRIAFDHQGTLDRIVGDAVAIMFSAPVFQTDHQARALRCAEAMLAFSSDFAAQARQRGVPFGVTRIGVHTGEVTIGNFGGKTIFDYRALGDPVNTASRLESVNKQLGTLVCVSAATLEGCQDDAARPVGRLVLKGKSEALMTYEPGFAAAAHPVVDAEAYRAAYRDMAENLPRALDAFRDLHQQLEADPLVSFHLARLREGQSGDRIVFDAK